MSDDWITRQIELMRASKNPELVSTAKIIEKNKSLIRRKVNVMDAKGKNSWNTVKLPQTKKFKE